MKQLSTGLLLSLLSFAGCGQHNNEIPVSSNPNTVLWKISGNGLQKPSFLFGTIHMLCKDEATLSDNMKKAIAGADEVYLELDMDDIMQMLTMMSALKMNNDTTLLDLLSEQDYLLVKDFFTKKSSLLPFSMLEKYKPILAASTLMEMSSDCGAMVSMEQMIMDQTKENKKEIKGLETFAEQVGMLDSIPYKLQAEQLVEYIKKEDKTTENNTLTQMMTAYKNQNLDSLEAMILREDMGMSNFTDIMLYQRNAKWVNKLKTILPVKSLVIAVGAGHLPGEKGVINLLKKAGYTVSPVENKAGKTVEI